MKKKMLGLIAAMLMGAVGCGVVDVETPTTQMVVEEAVIEKVDTAKTELARQDNAHIGIWSSKKGYQTDGAAEYQNFYICLFENGSAIRYGWRFMSVGSWTEEDGTITATYDRLFTMGQPVWEQHEGSVSMYFTYDMQQDVFCLTDASEVDDFTANRIYYPAEYTNAYETCARFIEHYRNLTGDDQTPGELYDGLRVLEHNVLMQLLPEDAAAMLETEEAAWQTEQEDSWSIMRVGNTKKRVKELLELLIENTEDYVAAEVYKRPVKLTLGYWYSYSEQTANCTEYQFLEDGTLIIRDRDVMNGTGEYTSERYVTYSVDEVRGVMTIHYPERADGWGTVPAYDLEYNMNEITGRLERRYTAAGHPEMVFSTYLEQYIDVPTMEQMRQGGIKYVNYWHDNIQKAK